MVVIAALGGFLAWIFWDSSTTEPELAVYSLSDRSFGYGEFLLIRRVSAHGDLLLKIINRDEIIRYNISDNTISKETKTLWDNAAGEVSICKNSAGFEEDGYGKFDAHGKYTIAAGESPGKTKLAVVSGYGPARRAPSFFFLGGGYIVYGSKYFEVKENSPAYRTISKVFRVSNRISEMLCWTPDENMVVIYSRSGLNFSVANFDQQPADERVSSGPSPANSSKPDLSRLTGRFSDHGIDTNGDGLFEKISIDVETETTLPGTYKFFVGAESSGGKPLSGWADARLNGGIEKTPIYIDTKEWFEQGVEGPFKINFIHLDDGSGSNLQILNDPGTTQGYKRTQFERPAIVFTGENTVTPIDKNKNGKYEGLEIQIGVDMLYPGNYIYRGDLYDGVHDDTGSGLIEFGPEKKAALKKGKGTITFYFSGSKIAEHGVSGAFKLTFVNVRGNGYTTPTNDLTGNLMKTPYFEAGRFEPEKNEH